MYIITEILGQGLLQNNKDREGITTELLKFAFTSDSFLAYGITSALALYYLEQIVKIIKKKDEIIKEEE